MTDRPGEGYIHRYSEGLKKLLAAKGGEPVHELAPELLAAIVVDEDPPEFSLLKQVVLWGAVSTKAAVVARNSLVGVANPAKSGVISVVLAYSADAGAASDIVIGEADPAQPAITITGNPVTNRRDTRARKLSTTLRQGDEAAQNVIAIWRDTISTTFGVPRYFPIVIGPGTVVWWENTVQNDAITLAVIGYERPLEESELT